MAAPIPDNEDERLASLREYRILDTEPEQAFDDLTQLAAHICGTPVALVSLIDADRQWFKSRRGIDQTETPRAVSFCAHAILGNDLFVVEDALEDPRFQENPFVTGEPRVRFYAGAPFVSRSGHALGTLCVVDRKPHTLSVEQMQALQALGREVERQLELRRNLIELEAALAQRDTLERQREELIARLQESLENVHRLGGLLPASSACKFTLTIPAKVSAITPVVDGVLETVRQMKAGQGREFEVEMALREALANAIVHGCGNDETKSVQCSVACEEGGDLTFVIRDPGEGFSPASVADPLREAGRYATHGRGIYLINSLMDDVEIRTKKEMPEVEGTEMHMRLLASSRQS